MSHDQGVGAVPLHPVLREQLWRHVGAAADGTLPPDLAPASARLRPLLEAVSAVYSAADRALRTYGVGVTPVEPIARPAPPPDTGHDYRALFEQHPMPMLLYEPGTARVLAANVAAVARYGYPTGTVPALDALGAEGRLVTRDGRRVTVVAGPALELDGRTARLAVVLDDAPRG